MSRYSSILLFVFFFISLKGYSQVPTQQDCEGAAIVCQNTFTISTLPTNTLGNFHPEIGSGICQDNGLNKVSYWMKVFIKSSGNLCFNITPLNASDDYNCSVFNVSNASCSDISSNASPYEVFCEFSTLTNPGQPTGPTGSNCISVTSGQTYMIYAANYAPSTFGFTIDFSSSTALIVDNSPPAIASSSSLVCGSSSIDFSFNEQVLCSTVQDADFTLTGGGTTFTLSGIPTPACGGAEEDSAFTLNFTPSISLPGFYQLCLSGGSDVTDRCGNIASGCFTIEAVGLGVVQDVVSDVDCFDGDNGSASMTITGGAAPYTYTWSTSPPQTTATATGLSGGNYILQVQDATGCSGQGTVSIAEPSVAVGGTPVSCDESTCDGSAAATVTGGIGSFNYEYWNTTFDTLKGTGQTVNGLCPGTYYCVTTDQGNGCKDTTVFTITEPVIGGSPISTSCLDSCDGSAIAIPMVGSISNAYSWSTGETTDSIGGLCAGSYGLTITNNDLSPPCVKTTTVVVPEPAALSGSITAFKNACFGVCDGSITFTMSGGTTPYIFTWEDDFGNPIGQTTATVTGLCQGNYLVTATDVNGCPQLAGSQSLIENSEILSSTSVVHTDCDVTNGSATVSVSGGAPPYNYSWSNSSTSTSLTGLSVGLYTCVITDAENCIDTALANLGYIDSNTATIQVISPISCPDSCDASITVNVIGGVPPYLYSWSIGSSDDTIFNLCADSIVVGTTDSTGCPGYASIVLTEPDPISASVTSTDETSCNSQDGSIDLTPSGGTAPYTYLWNDTSAQTIQDISSLIAGTYRVTVNDANGCPAATGQATINPGAPIEFSLTGTDITCFGYNDGFIDLVVDTSTGQSPYIYTWSDSVTISEDYSNATSGTYSVAVSDINNCPPSLETITLSQPDIIDVELSTFCLNGFGNITATSTGGTEPYFYSWSNGMVSTELSDLDPGTYSVSVTDVNNCPEDTEEIEFEPCTIEIPNAFTPNKDGTNDVWALQNMASFPDAVIRIYNRWGDVVFKSNGYDTPWDGNHQLTNQKLPNAVYYYVIENIDPKFVETGSLLQGYVTIVR